MRNFYILLLTFFITSLGFGQTTIFNEGGGGSEPTDWTFTNNATSNPIDKGSYWLVDSGNPSDIITTATYDLSSYTDAEFTLNVASFGGGGHNSAKIEISFDGGSNYTQTENSTTTTSSSYIDGGTFTLNSVTSQVVIKISNNGTSGRGVRLRNLELTASGTASNCTAPTTQATAYNTTSIGTSSATLNWTDGDGDEVLVLVKEGAAVDTDPTNGTSYAGNTAFTSGDQIGTGNFAVYAGTTASTVSVTGLTAGTTYHVAVYEYNTTDTCYELTQLTGNFTTNPVTTVQFSSASATVNEGSGTYDLILEIANEDTVATSVDIALTSGDVSEINGYTTQTVTFAGGSPSNESVTITITDDTVFEGDETLTFTLQNISGGSNAQIGSRSTFNLTLEENDLPTATIPYNEDFSDCGTQKWTVATAGAAEEWTCGSGSFEANAFGSSGTADDYLISPSFDMDAQTDETLSFNSWTIYADVTSPQIELLYTLNYTGDPSTTTWVNTLNPTWPAPNSQTTTSSGNIDVSGIIGTSVHFAFRYTSTGTAVGSTEGWRIEDFDIITASTPIVTISETTLSGLDYEDGSGPSSEQTFTVEGSSLTADITITAPTNFEVSNTSGSGFGSTVTLTPTSGNFATTTIYVRLASGLAVNTYSGTLTASSTGAVQQDISLSGEVTFASCAGTSTTFPFSGVSGSTNLDHDSSGSNPSGSSAESCGTNYRIFYDSAPSTDGSGNYIRSNAIDGLIESADWGGTGKFETFSIDVSGETSIDIETFGNTTNSGFNANNEQFQWWYKLDGGSETNLGSAFGSGISYTGSLAIEATTIDVTGLNNIIVGFTFNMNGGSDGFEDVDVTVTTTPIAYTFNGTWSPSDPTGNSTTNDDIVISNGDAIISSNTTINGVTVNAGASLTVNTAIELTTNSIDLESTSTSYSSLINNGTVTGTLTYNRYVSQVAPTGTNDLITSPFSGQTFGTFATANSGALAESGNLRAFAPFNNNSNAYDNYDTSSNDPTVITSGQGYRAGTINGETLAFEGTLNNSDLSVPLSVGSSSFWNLIGNPYSSYIDAEAFLTANSSSLRPTYVAIYGYNADNSNGQNSRWTILDSNSKPNTLTAPGQGFFVAAPDGGGTSANFTLAMRTTGIDDDFIAGRNTTSDANFAHAILNLETASTSYLTNFYFRDINTLGLDPGYDTGAYDQSTDGIFSNLVADHTGVALANQSLPYANLSDQRVPLVINANAGEQLTFSINADSSLPTNINVYIEDQVTGATTLLNTSDYVLTPASNLSGAGRFYVVFSDSALNTTEENFSNIKMYTLEKDLMIEGFLLDNTTVKIFDLQGRAIISVPLDITSQINTINMNPYASGVYIVQLTNNTVVKSQKIILK